MKIIFTDHARLRMDIRNISEDMVKEALTNPDSTLEEDIRIGCSLTKPLTAKWLKLFMR